MQDLKIDGLLDNVMMNAANVCGNLTTIKASFNELKKEIEAKDEEIEKCYKHTMYLEKELDKTCKTKELDLENHNKRDMALVDELAKKNDEIKQLKEETEKLKVDLIHEREKNEKLAKAHAELENDMRKSSVEVSDKDKVIADLEESKRYWKRQSINDQDEIKERDKHIIDRNATIMQLEKQVKYLEKELEKTRTCKNVEVGMLKEENDNLKAQNERLKTEVTEVLAKRDYWQDFANKEANEAADAKKVKQDCEKEMEWQKKKLQEFDYVLTKYRAKIKELEDANRFFKLMINLIIKE